MNTKIVENKDEVMEIFFETDEGIFYLTDMTLPLQMLFDDIMTFVSITDS